MKTLFKISGALTAVSGLISLYLFANPVPQNFMPHFVLPLLAFIGLIIMISAYNGPKPKQNERGFWSVLLGVPILAILFQLHDLAASIPALFLFQSELVPILGLHLLFGAVGNYVTTAKSLLTGLPTPWNLRSDLSWRKSHRLLGFGMVLLALVSGSAALIQGTYNATVMGIGLAILVTAFILYSWWLWHKDPERKSLYGTS